MGESRAGRAGLSPAAAQARWSRLHHGIDPSQVPFLRGWLRMVSALARPLAPVPPLALTALGPVLAAVALVVAVPAPWLALLLVVAAAMCDALDGAVAAQADRATPFGAVADKTADRIADTLFALMMWRCGAPLGLAVLAAAISLVHEAIRELRGGELRSRITVAERPTRVICALLACVCAGVSGAAWPPTVCAAVWVALGAVGLAQLASYGIGRRFQRSRPRRCSRCERASR